MSGRFISTYSVVLSLPMRISKLPERGGSIHAAAATSLPAGGFTTLCAAAKLGVPTATASPLGTGPNSFMVRQLLAEAGVKILIPELVGDIGVAIQLIEDDGSMTSIVTTGVESEPSRESLDQLDLHDGDLVHISGSDLVSETSAEVLVGWAENLPKGITVLVSASPSVAQVPASVWLRILRRADIVSRNIREAGTLSDILGGYEPGLSLQDATREDAVIVRRLGVMGCEVFLKETGEKISLPAYEANTVDTAGVGDTHIATMCAALLLGHDPVEAARMANAAAAITISHESALPVPTWEQIHAVMKHGDVTH